MPNLQTTQSEVPPGTIDFGLGHPGSDLLPRTLLERAAALRLATDDPSLLQYGLEQGDGYFRLALADLLTQRYGFLVQMDDLFVTAGASVGLDLICTLFTQPGDIVFVEEPTYFLALRIFTDHGLRVVNLPTDDQGLRIDGLEEALTRQTPTLLYTIPTHQNPSGATLPMERREQLVALSRQHGFLIVADEVYHLLSYEGTPPPPMACYAAGETVLSLGSFSKILAPGLRLGWVQAAPAHLYRLVHSGLLDSGGGLNPFTSGLVRIVLERGWQEEHLTRLRAVYRQRLAALSTAVRTQLGDTVRFVEPSGGYFLWVGLPAHVDAAALLPVAEHRKVGFRTGALFSGRAALDNYLRLSFAYHGDDDLVEGVYRLRQVLIDVGVL